MNTRARAHDRWKKLAKDAAHMQQHLTEHGQADWSERTGEPWERLYVPYHNYFIKCACTRNTTSCWPAYFPGANRSRNVYNYILWWWFAPKRPPASQPARPIYRPMGSAAPWTKCDAAITLSKMWGNACVRIRSLCDRFGSLRAYSGAAHKRHTQHLTPMQIVGAPKAPRVRIMDSRTSHTPEPEHDERMRTMCPLNRQSEDIHVLNKFPNVKTMWCRRNESINVHWHHQLTCDTSLMLSVVPLREHK